MVLKLITDREGTVFNLPKDLMRFVKLILHFSKRSSSLRTNIVLFILLFIFHDTSVSHVNKYSLKISRMVHNIRYDWTINYPFIAIEVIGHFININTTAVNIFVPSSFVCTADYVFRSDFKSETTQSERAHLSGCFVVVQFYFMLHVYIFFCFKDENGFFFKCKRNTYSIKTKRHKEVKITRQIHRR